MYCCVSARMSLDRKPLDPGLAAVSTKPRRTTISAGAAGTVDADSRHNTTERKLLLPAPEAPCSTKRTRREFLVTSLMMVPGELMSFAL